MALRKEYGDKIEGPEGEEDEWEFPSVGQLKKASVERLERLGFGYRGKYILESTKVIEKKGGEAWLLGLRGKPNFQVREELCKLPGIGM
eukprot:CAMPEP_0202976668 /NCGR_PEP_ID=MMETSP1396-20130829/79610_1 /ASSEMBLY_ACC=CAM_ASM_000872 /TAXON_ID= /ORGANISM="Pseudokeronopsis sp., Strain Brazil" /LENGTH=88 /DNA_ID=CAMNT_0049714423 /DNA_START=81 /DNA_END=344 /DNA_ORIENTATION=+